MELSCWRGAAAFEHIQEPAEPSSTNTVDSVLHKAVPCAGNRGRAVCQLPRPCQNCVQVSFPGHKTGAWCLRKRLQSGEDPEHVWVQVWVWLGPQWVWLKVKSIGHRKDSAWGGVCASQPHRGRGSQYQGTRMGHHMWHRQSR